MMRLGNLFVRAVLCGGAMLAGSNAASAALVIADFNDLAAGNIQTQFGGTGLDPADDWGDTALVKIISGDLSAPVSTGYAITQAGTPLSVRGDSVNNPRQSTRGLAEPLTGTIWFSFLINQPTDFARGGIGFNQSAFGPGDPRIIFTGNDLKIGGPGKPLETPLVDVLGFNQTHLVLGRIITNAGALGEEAVSIWIDPDLANLGVPHGEVTNLDLLTAAENNSIKRLSIQSYVNTGGTQGGTLDSIRLSDGPNAFFDVTGVVPEPAALSLLALAGLLLSQRRNGTRRGVGR